MNRTPLWLACFAATAALVGCDWLEGKKTPSAKDLKQGASNALETVRQMTGAAGKIDVQIDSARRSASGCYARLYLLSDGRPNILQITSYADPTAEKFPSVFIRTQVAYGTPGALANRRLEAQQVYIQAAAAGPIWKTPDGQTAQLSITAVDGNQFEATLSGVLVDAATGESSSITAKLLGEIEQPSAAGAAMEAL